MAGGGVIIIDDELCLFVVCFLMFTKSCLFNVFFFTDSTMGFITMMFFCSKGMAYVGSKNTPNMTITYIIYC